MTVTSQMYQPYYRDGKLYLPERTVRVLMEAGLAHHTGAAAQVGIDLDAREHIDAIRSVVEKIVEQLDETSVIRSALTDPETQFMLNSRPAHSA